NDRLLDVALTYIDLLQAYAELAIAGETLQNARELLRDLEVLLSQGKSTKADMFRVRTEASIRERDYLQAQGRIQVVSAHLARLLNLPPDMLFQPLEPALVPITLIPEAMPLHELIAQGMSFRPELAENQAYSRAAYERWREAKMAPLLPSLQVSMAAGGFGGGPNSFFGDFDGRSDVTALAVWRLQNLGLGNLYQSRERRSQYGQLTLRQLALQNQVGDQIVSAATLVQTWRQELTPAQVAVRSARESVRLNFIGIVSAPEKYRPIEPLQAIQALSNSRLDYLQAVAGYNRAQFQLYAALGNPPLAALQTATPWPISEPVTPQR